MLHHISLVGLTSILAFAATSAATAGSGSSVLLGDASWETFAAAPATASFAWAGEGERFDSALSLLGEARQGVQLDESVVDLELVTGIAAPEPPAWVLAGLAFGGVLCGRSLLGRRKSAEAIVADEDANA